MKKGLRDAQALGWRGRISRLRCRSSWCTRSSAREPRRFSSIVVGEFFGSLEIVHHVEAIGVGGCVEVVFGETCDFACVDHRSVIGMDCGVAKAFSFGNVGEVEVYAEAGCGAGSRTGNLCHDVGALFKILYDIVVIEPVDGREGYQEARLSGTYMLQVVFWELVSQISHTEMGEIVTDGYCTGEFYAAFGHFGRLRIVVAVFRARDGCSGSFRRYGIR